MNKNKLLAITCPIAFMAFSVYIYTETLLMTRVDRMFPQIIAIMMFVVGAIQLISDLRKTEIKNKFKNSNLPRVALVVAALALYVFLLKKIGYIFDTLWLSAAIMVILGYRKWPIIALSSVISTGFLFVVFKLLLKVTLPTLWL